MRRREFFGVLSGAVVACPIAVQAQRSDKPVIGLLAQGTSSAWNLAGFYQGLKDAGYVEGQNLAIEYRFADDDYARLIELAADLVRQKVRVIMTIASGFATRAARDATNTIPIVFAYGLDPVQQGYVASLNHPGGNVTGSISLANELFGKRVGLLHELVPHATHLGVLTNPKGISRQAIANETQTAASALGLIVEMADAGNSSDEIDAAFARLGDEKRVQALLVANDPFFITQRAQIVALAARYAIPTIYPFREMAEAGGLLSYGTNIFERDRQAGLYVGRILKGENPAELPVVQMNRFELVINLKAAKALGLSFSNSMQLLADDVLE
jgi:putative ABC transport system substrate-binding protein